MKLWSRLLQTLNERKLIARQGDLTADLKDGGLCFAVLIMRGIWPRPAPNAGGCCASKLRACVIVTTGGPQPPLPDGSVRLTGVGFDRVQDEETRSLC